MWSLRIVKRFRIRVIIILLILCLAAPVYGSTFGMLENDRVQDQGGRHIQVKKPFARIISLYGAHTENLFSLGLDAEIIGVTRNEVFPPKALSKPVFSYHDDPEKFIAARPDLVLIRPMIDRGYTRLIKRLEQCGIVVVSLQPANVDEMYDYWRVLGVLTGRSGQAEQMVTRFKTAVSAFQALIKGVEKKRVYFESIHRRMKTFRADAMAVFALEMAGGVHIAAGAKSSRGTNVANYGKERILSHAGEMDVYLAQYGPMNRVTVDQIKGEPGFNTLKAVQNDQVYVVNEHLVSRPTLRLLDGIYTIGTILHPRRFKPGARQILESAKQDQPTEVPPQGGGS